MPDCAMQAEPIVIPQRLNNTPMLRGHRQFFYNDACAAVKKAVKGNERLMSVKYYFCVLLGQSSQS